MYLWLDLGDIKARVPRSHDRLCGAAERLRKRLEHRCSYIAIKVWMDAECVQVAVSFAFHSDNRQRSASAAIPLKMLRQQDAGAASIEGAFAILQQDIERTEGSLNSCAETEARRAERSGARAAVLPTIQQPETIAGTDMQLGMLFDDDPQLAD